MRFSTMITRNLMRRRVRSGLTVLGLAIGIEAFYQRHWWLVFGMIASSYSLTLRRTRDTATAKDGSDAQAC